VKPKYRSSKKIICKNFGQYRYCVISVKVHNLVCVKFHGCWNNEILLQYCKSDETNDEEEAYMI
jgi:hypothetical protein